MNHYFNEYQKAFDLREDDQAVANYTQEQLESTDQDLVETEKRFLDYEAGLKHPESV